MMFKELKKKKKDRVSAKKMNTLTQFGGGGG
jgi:hypothetical protein